MPTEKRQRQKEGRQKRLEAQRKVQRRRSLIRRGGIIVVIAAVVAFTAYKIAGPSKSGPPVRQVTTKEIAHTLAVNTKLAKIITKQEALNKAQLKAAQNRATSAAVAAGCPAKTTTRVNKLRWAAAPAMTISTSGTYDAIVKTDLGSFTISLDAKDAPIVVNNFVFLAKHGYYNCTIFHRVIPLFMDQTGDPTGTGSGGPGYTIADEWPERTSNASYQYPVGGVAMAANANPQTQQTIPHTAGSQFFVIVGANGEGLGATYSLFGTVTKGLAVAAAINGEGTANGIPQVTHRILKVTIIGPTA